MVICEEAGYSIIIYQAHGCCVGAVTLRMHYLMVRRQLHRETIFLQAAIQFGAHRILKICFRFYTKINLGSHRHLLFNPGVARDGKGIRRPLSASMTLVFFKNDLLQIIFLPTLALQRARGLRLSFIIRRTMHCPARKREVP